MEQEKSFTPELSLLNVDMLYLLMVNRIARRYSAEELAFLLGEPTDIITEMECLQRIGFGTKMIYKLRQVFENYTYAFGYPTTNNAHTATYRMDIKQIPDKTIYTLERIINTHESVLVFQLQEGVHQYNFDDRPNVREREAIRYALKESLKTSIFDQPLSPFEIFNLLAETIGHVYPFNLEHELHQLVGRKGKAPLKRFKCRTLGFRYVRHKVPK